MTHTEQWLRNAIEGGWIPASLVGQMTYSFKFEDRSSGFFPPVFLIQDDLSAEARQMFIQEILLDPSAWAAVGKVRGWPGDIKAQAKYYMREFITYVADGKSIEEALGEISK